MHAHSCHAIALISISPMVHRQLPKASDWAVIEILSGIPCTADCVPIVAERNWGKAFEVSCDSGPFSPTVVGLCRNRSEHPNDGTPAQSSPSRESTTTKGRTS